MALSGTLYSAWNTSRRLEINWRVTEQSIENNTSTIYIVMRCYTAKATYFSNDAYQYRFNGDGGVIRYDKKSSDNSYLTLRTMTVTVNHAADGSGVFPIYLAYPYYWGGGYTMIINDNIVVDDIPRATTPIVEQLTIGVESSINVEPVVDSWVHTLRWSCGSGSGTIAERTTEKSVAWTPPATLANQFATDAATTTVAIDCDTYSGETLIGTKRVTAVLTMPNADGYRPNNVSVTFGTGTTAGSSVDFDSSRTYIQGKTSIPVNVTAAFHYGATMSGASVAVDGKQLGLAPLNVVFSDAGNRNVSAVVTDSRGLTNTGTATIKIHPYHAPKIVSCNAFRCDAFGSANDDGELVRIVAETSVSECDSKNKKLFAVYTKTSGGTYAEKAAGMLSAYENNTLDVIISGLSADITFDVRLSITDAFSTANTVRTVATSENVFDINASGKGFAFGKASETDTLECDMPAMFYDDVTFGGMAINLWHSIGQTRNAVLEQDVDFNDVKTVGLFGITRTDHTNQPTPESGTLIVRSGEGGAIDITRPWCYLQQIFIPRTPSAVYMRSLIVWGNAGVWTIGKWYKFSGTQI